MGEFADRMGTKNPGDLILSSDWNSVVSEIDTINGNVASVDSKADENLEKIQAIESRISQAETELQSLLSSIDTLRSRFRRVTLNAQRYRFAFGETGVITATVTEVDGSPIDFASSQRPWIDFVTVWGRLSPADGYASSQGEGGRTISVQVDGQGVAKVKIGAESAAGATTEEESSVHGVLQTVDEEGITFAERIVSANTPQDMGMEKYYQTVNRMYESSPGRHFTRYVDKFSRDAMFKVEPDHSITEWYFNDHRTTVMAFVKGDNNPLTAEPSLGTASIQITFRDWFYPWLVLGFLTSYAELVDDYVEMFRAVAGQTYSETSDAMQKQVEEIVRDKGMMGRQRDYMAMEEALSRITAGDGPSHIRQVAMHAKESIGVQKVMNLLPGNSMETFKVLTGMDARTMEQVEKAELNVAAATGKEMERAKTEIYNEVRSLQQEFRDEIFSETSPVALPSLQRKVQAIETKVQGLVALDPEKVVSKLNQVTGIEQRLMVLEGRG